MTARPAKQAMFEQLVADGFSYMFGNPGTVEQGFLDVLGTVPQVKYVLGLQETVAISIADGYARAGARPALVQLHSGVGLGNGIGMLYQAKRGHSPLVVIAGEAGVAYEAMDAQMAADLVTMARPVTKYATRVVDPRSVLRVLRRAVKMAMTPPRGPVFVALPMDVLDELTAETAAPTVVPSRAVVPAPPDVDAAASALAGAARPVILMGDGVAASGAQAELTRLAELLAAPVWGVDSSEVNMDTTHPLFAGNTGHMFGHASAERIADADAVLIVGTYVFPEVFPELGNPFPSDATIVHIDLDDYEIAKNHPVHVALVADPKLTLAAIADRLAGVLPAARRQPPASREVRQVGDDGSLMAQFAGELAAQAPDDLIVFEEALTAEPDLVRQLRPRRPGSFFTTRGGSLGIGIPGAIGAKLARPEAEVVGFAGDGGSMYTIQALWTAAHHGIPARFVICNNHRYALLDANIEEYWVERGIAAHDFPIGFDLSGPDLDFVGLARGMGVDGVQVTKPSDVEAAVGSMLSAHGPFLVDLLTDPPGEDAR